MSLKKSYDTTGNRPRDRPTSSAAPETLRNPRPLRGFVIIYILEKKGHSIGAVIDGCTGLFISPSGTSELDCATTKTDTTERSISIGRESLKVFLY